MDGNLRRWVWERASGRCEYCQMRQEFDELTFQIEHIIPRKHHGADDAENLALACFACNNHKGANLSGIDPQTGVFPVIHVPVLNRVRRNLFWGMPGVAGFGLTTDQLRVR